jgi:hypothetical protein
MILLTGIFQGFWENDPYPWHWEFQGCLGKMHGPKMHDWNYAVIKWMQKNPCPKDGIFKHLSTNYSEEAIIFKDVGILYSIFLFCNFQLGIFSCGLGK